MRRLCLVDGMDLDHIEGWLKSMAARGLHYDQHSDASSSPPAGELAAVRYWLKPRGTPDCPSGICLHPGMGADRYMGKGFSLFRTWNQTP